MSFDMSYRNGTYIAFHANNTANPTESDMKYYNTLKMWRVRDDNDFNFINSHEKTGSARDSSQRETLERSLKERLNNSKNMILVIGNTTKQDNDWIPFEISYAIDNCGIPIIAAYPDYEYILSPKELSILWPKALLDRINSGDAHVIHIPFKEKPLASAVSQFDFNNFPLGGGLGYYSRESYVDWGIISG